MVEIGEKLKQMRKMLGLTQEQMAEAAGVTRQSVAQWEAGNTSPTIECVKRIGMTIGKDMSTLLRDDENMPHEMTINEYQALAMRTAEEKGRTWGNVGLGMAGEAGEVADIVKKHLYQGHPLDHDKLLEEAGDVAWYLALAATVAGVTLESVLMANIAKLTGRYPDGFEPEKSINRKG